MASELKVNVIVNASGDNDSGIDLATNDQVLIKTADTTAVTVDANQNVKVGGIETDQTSPLMVKTNASKHAIYLEENSGQESWQIGISPNGDLDFRNSGGTDPAVKFLDSDVFLFGKTADDNTSAGATLSTGGNGFVRANAAAASFNRTGDDGEVVRIQQAGTTEGNIVVTGSTVDYNGFCGLHESSGIATDTPIGTVISTINELDVYFAKQGEGDDEEDNPKSGQTRADHAKVKVSDTEGDKAVYGVVKRFNAQGKVNVASVGIGSVRVTGACEKGDLLESNGDGTAKVQSDDIVRSKTIGKVTIGNSSTDVKLVSCVLYCG